MKAGLSRYSLMLSVTAVCLLFCPVTLVSGAHAAPPWLQEGQPVPEQFTFSGETPSIEEVREALILAFGAEPSGWPDEFRRIHDIQVAFNRRAMASSKFKGQFGGEVLEKMKAQDKDPVGYWARSLHDGWGFEEWFNNEHLTVQGVPRALLGRFVREIFPLMWRDIRSTIHVQEFMMGLADKKFIPYNNYDSRVLSLRKQDVIEYNRAIEKAAENFILDNDFLMLVLMPRLIDTNWVGDAGFESSLVNAAKKLTERVQSEVREMDQRFRKAFYEALPVLTYSWNSEPWSENHVILNGEPLSISPSADTLGSSTRIEHPYIGEKTTIREQTIVTGGALKIQWGISPEHSDEFDSGAVVERLSPRYMIARKHYGGSREFVLSLYLDHVSGFGHEVSFAPSDGAPYPGDIEEEMMDAVSKAFFEAAEVLYGRPYGRSRHQQEVSDPARPAAEKVGEVRKIVLDPPGKKVIDVGSSENGVFSFHIGVWDERSKIPHAEVSIRKPSIGSISSKNATGGDEKWLFVRTGPLGDAEISYIPPTLEELQLLGPTFWDIVITVEDPQRGIRASLPLKVTRPKGVDINVQHAVFPADPSFANRVVFSFDGRGPDSDPEERFRVNVKVLSGKGVLSPKQDETAGGRVFFTIEIEADKDHELYYRWMGGEMLEGPVSETILFEVPELEIRGSASFSVGVDPNLLSDQRNQEKIEQPGLFIPIKVYVQDEYHPDLDLEDFFKAFDLTPVLDIRQTGFDPVDLEGSKSREVLEAILKQIRGAELPRDVLSLSPGAWSLARGSGSRWFIVGDSSGEDVHAGGVFPGVIPWEYGDYTFSISMNLQDPTGATAEPLMRTMTRILHVRPFPSSALDGQAELVMPILLAFSAVFPGEESRLFAVKGRDLLQQGDLETVAVTLGEYFSQRLSPRSLPDMKNTAGGDRLIQLIAKAHGISGAPPSDEILYESMSWASRNFLCAISGVFAEAIMSGGYDLDLLSDKGVSSDMAELKVLEIIKAFLDGYGDYGIVALERKNIRSLEIFTESGERLSEFSGQVFAGGVPSGRIVSGEHSIVVPFRLGENLTITLRGNGKPVSAIKILPNGINFQHYGYRKGSETISVYGDVVRP